MEKDEAFRLARTEAESEPVENLEAAADILDRGTLRSRLMAGYTVGDVLKWKQRESREVVVGSHALA